jgi:hypothetical protein
MAEQEAVVAAEPIGGPVPTDKVNAEEHTKPEEAGDPQAIANQGDTEEEQRRKSGYQRQKEARLRAEAEARYLRELLAQKDAPKPESQTQAEAEPNPDEFETQGDYLRAHTQWALKEARRAAREEYEAQKKAESEQAEAQKRNATWEEKRQAARAKYEDFDEAVASMRYLPSQEAQTLIMESPVGVEVAYHLATNEAEAQRIASLPPHQQLFAIGKLEAAIEARIAGQKTEPAQEAPKPAPVSKAPAPPSPVRKSAPADNGELRDDLPVEEWRKRYLKKTRK